MKFKVYLITILLLFFSVKNVSSQVVAEPQKEAAPVTNEGTKVDQKAEQTPLRPQQQEITAPSAELEDFRISFQLCLVQ